MKGLFFAGMALGALAGAILVEANPKVKKMSKDGANAVKQQIKSMTK